MATMNYSGSQSVTGCSITTWTTSTYYSFKLTEDCKISVGGTPAINARSGEEFIIQTDTAYIFDRDTTVMLAYPIVESTVISTQRRENTTGFNFSIDPGLYYPIVSLVADRDYSSYDIFGFVRLWLFSSETGVITRITLNGSTILATRSDNYTATQTYFRTLDASLTTAISKNDVLSLEVEGSGSMTYIINDADPALLRIEDTA